METSSACGGPTDSTTVPAHRDNSDVATTYTSPPILPPALIVKGVPDLSSPRKVRREFEIFVLFCICHICIGFSMGAISPSMEPISRHFNLTESWRGLLGAAALAGNILGSPMGGLLADLSGRRGCMLVAWMVFALSASSQASATSIMALCLSRLVLGWSVGAHYTGATAYLSETLPENLCGRLLAIVEAHFFIGNFLSIGAGALFRKVIPNEDIQWRLTVSCCAVPVVFGIVWFYFRAPESQSWIRAKRTHSAQAQTEEPYYDEQTFPPRVHSAPPICEAGRVVALPSSENACSVGEVIEGQDMSTARAISFVSIFWSSLIVPTYAVSAFAVAIISSLQLSVDPFIFNTWLGGAAALGVFLGVGLVDTFGRKPLLLLSQWGVAAAFAILAGLRPSGSWACAVGMVSAFVLFEVLNGAGAPLALVYPAEIFPARIKGMASGICAMNSRITAVLSILLMPVALAHVGTRLTLLAVSLFSAVGALVTHVMAPPEKRAANPAVGEIV